MDTKIKMPSKLPIMVISDGVLFPGMTIRIPVSTVKNINLVRSRLISGNQLRSSYIGVVPKEIDKDSPYSSNLKGLHDIGTAGLVIQVTGTNYPRPSYTLLVTGVCRFQLLSLIQEHPYPVGAVEPIYNSVGRDEDKLKTLIDELKAAARILISMWGDTVPAVAKLKRVMNFIPIQQLADLLTAIIQASLPERMKVLDAIDTATRINAMLPLLKRHIQKLQGDEDPKIGRDSRKDKSVVVTRGGRNLSSDLGVDEDSVDEMEELEDKINAANMPTHAHKAVMKELRRLKQMPAHMPEYFMTRNYLDLAVELPWSLSAQETCNISKARADLDADHYGLEKVKLRVLEYLAVRQLRGDLKGPILCFVGPPGVGKTSIVKSIATTLGRPYFRMSLGGVSDQHDIRGHRKTYIGAMPGRVIQGLRSVKVNNPVMLLDEIDKLGSGIRGDPAAALLEVLDPEQNANFTDTYLNLPFDLSQILFVATANTLSTIPTPLMDRMEIINVPGYTQEEKEMIGMLHLLPKQLKEHGLSAEILNLPQDTIASIIEQYTREAGVRGLERKIGAVCRSVAVQVAEIKSDDPGSKTDSDLILSEVNNEEISKTKDNEEDEYDHVDNEDEEALESPIKSAPESAALAHSIMNLTELREHMDLPISVDRKMIQDILGPPIFQSGLAGRVSVPGVAVGLAWTPVGGEVLVVEATVSAGDSNFTLTGQLGSVMQESAKIALSWVRQHSEMLHLHKDFMKDEEIHMHFPAGAIGKDGPSAGVTILTVLVSLLTKQCVRSNVAMTGEITLNGIVLPVGGIKDKLLAAHRAGLTTVILPAANKKDLVEIPKSVLNEVEVVLVNTVEEVLLAAFEDGFTDIFGIDNLPDDEPKPISTQSKL